MNGAGNNREMTVPSPSGIPILSLKSTISSTFPLQNRGHPVPRSLSERVEILGDETLKYFFVINDERDSNFGSVGPFGVETLSIESNTISWEVVLCALERVHARRVQSPDFV